MTLPGVMPSHCQDDNTFVRTSDLEHQRQNTTVRMLLEIPPARSKSFILIAGDQAYTKQIRPV
jgi:hypothetical protein